MELPPRCWLWGGFIQTQKSIKFATRHGNIFSLRMFFGGDSPHALKQEIMFPIRASPRPGWCHRTEQACSCVVQCGHCSTAQLLLLDWAVKAFGSVIQTFYQAQRRSSWSMTLLSCSLSLLLGIHYRGFKAQTLELHRIVNCSMISFQ